MVSLSFATLQILVDVPCSNDRLSVTEDTNSLFRPDRIRERLQLPELQAQLLVHCLQLLKPGGSLVYSTCSLSPIQNDGVVNMALTKAFTDFHITTTIKYAQKRVVFIRLQDKLIFFFGLLFAEI